MKLTKRTLSRPVAILSIATGVLTTGADASSTTSASGSWPYPNDNVADTRVATSSTISSANVSGLTIKLTGAAAAGVGSFKNGAGSLVANPMVINGVVYLQDLDSNVFALALASWKLKWKNDLVFTTLFHGSLIALNRSTGAIVFRQQLPTSTNSPIAIAGNTVLVPTGGGGPALTERHPAVPQLVANRAP